MLGVPAFFEGMASLVVEADGAVDFAEAVEGVDGAFVKIAAASKVIVIGGLQEETIDLRVGLEGLEHGEKGRDLLGAEGAVEAGAEFHMKRIGGDEKGFFADVVGVGVEVSSAEFAAVKVRFVAVDVVGGNDVSGALESDACVDWFFSPLI